MLHVSFQRPQRAVGSHDINEALVIYTGFGSSKFPRARSRELLDRFGAEHAASLKLEILRLLDAMRDAPDDATRRSGSSVTERAIAHLQVEHPELDGLGLKALAWTYAFGLRQAAGSD